MKYLINRSFFFDIELSFLGACQTPSRLYTEVAEDCADEAADRDDEERDRIILGFCKDVRASWCSCDRQ